MRIPIAIATIILCLASPATLWAQSEDDADLITYQQFARMSAGDQDQYLSDLREALEALSSASNQYGLPLVVESTGALQTSRRQIGTLAILEFLTKVAEARTCTYFDGVPYCDQELNNYKLQHPGAVGQRTISDSPELPKAERFAAPAMERKSGPGVSAASAGSAVVHRVAEPVKVSDPARTQQPVQAQVRRPAASVRKSGGKCGTVAKKDLPLLKAKYRAGKKAECIYGGYISQEASAEGPTSPYVSGAHGCRPMREDKYEGTAFKCANAKQVLCNPLLFGLSGSGTAVCVAPQAHATLACGDLARSEHQKYGKVYENWQVQFRQMGSVQDHWREFSTQLKSLCSDKEFGDVHCEECGYFHSQLRAAAARAKTLHRSPQDQQGSPEAGPQVNKQVS